MSSSTRADIFLKSNFTFNCYTIPFPCFSKPDVSPPDFGDTCPNTTVEYADSNSVSKRINWTEPHATDNSKVAPTVHHVGKNPGDVFPEGIHSVKYIFTDGSGNRAECSFQVSVSGNYS